MAKRTHDLAMNGEDNQIFGVEITYPAPGTLTSETERKIMAYQFAIAGAKPVDLDKIVAALRKQAPKNKPALAKQSIGTQAGVTESVVVVLGAEDPHTHPKNDLIIFVIEGGGYVQLFPGRIKAPVGSVAVIPKGVCHAFHNTSANGSVVIATFSPAKVAPPGKCIKQ